MKGEEEERREGESGVAIKILGAIGAEAQLALAMAGEVATDRSISYQNLLQFSPQKTKFIFEKKKIQMKLLGECGCVKFLMGLLWPNKFEMGFEILNGPWLNLLGLFNKRTKFWYP